jgi:long-chain acyl-CoA synthetase
MFTSGSTAAPRPVYRRTDAVIAAVRASVDAMALPRGSGVIASMPLARAYGFNHGLVAAVVLDGPLALLRRFHHTAVLKLFASRAYEYWVGTPVMIDVLGRCRLSAARHPAPRVCDVGGRLAADVARRFEERFGVPPRQHYGTTETGTVSVHGVKVDGEATAGGRPELAGHPLRGVEVRIGDDPRTPAPAGTVGRIWLTSRYMMEGYGFPGGLVVPDTVAGWWATPDVGHLDGAGRLTVTGRLDDAVRTDAGQLVNPGHVAAALETYPGIIDVAVVAVTTGAGPVLGVVVESGEPPSLAELRAHLWRSLPAWSQPRVVEVTDRLPRLTNGRIDRRACVARLARALARGAPRVSS